MKTIYIVTAGDYSDYRVNAIFSTKKNAEKYIEAFNWARRSKHSSKARIEEWSLDDFPIHKSIQVWVGKDGSIDPRFILKQINSHNSPGLGRFIKHGDRFSWYVETDDEQRAIKVASEKWSQIIALGIWGDEEKVRELV